MLTLKDFIAASTCIKHINNTLPLTVSATHCFETTLKLHLVEALEILYISKQRNTNNLYLNFNRNLNYHQGTSICFKLVSVD